jgi:hypothetical protein
MSAPLGWRDHPRQGNRHRTAQAIARTGEWRRTPPDLAWPINSITSRPCRVFAHRRGLAHGRGRPRPWQFARRKSNPPHTLRRVRFVRDRPRLRDANAPTESRVMPDYCM